jgi:hypothetical protein
VIVEEVVDGGLQIDHRLDDAARETALGEGREEAMRSSGLALWSL